MSLVSVIIPVYNVEKYIKECVNSFLNQTYKNFELIFINDSSTDKTLEILHSFNDERIKIFTIEKSNAGCARNFGIEKAGGKWIIFFDGDDFCNKHFIEKMHNQAEKFEADVAICASCEFSEKKKKFSRHRISHTLKNIDKNFQNCALPLYKIDNCLLELVEPWNKIYNKNFLLNGNSGKRFEFQEITNSNDTFFFYSTILSAEKITFVFDELVYTRRNHKASLSSKAGLNWKDYFISYQKTDEFVLQYEHFENIKESYFKRKFGAYKYFYKKIGLMHKIPYLIKVQNEIKKANEILNNRKYSLIKFMIS